MWLSNWFIDFDDQVDISELTIDPTEEDWRENSRPQSASLR